MTGHAPRNPWLQVPAADYEGHMRLPEVGQLQALSAIFGAVCRHLQPSRVLILGCATGNGLEWIDLAATQRVLGVDINPQYLVVARGRHAARLPGLELECLDLERAPLPEGQWDLVWAGLIFEYLSPPPLLARIAAALAPAGRLLTVLQLPCATVAEVTPTPYASLKQLAPLMRLVNPGGFQAVAASAGLALERDWVADLPNGKQFWCGLHQAPAGPSAG